MKQEVMTRLSRAKLWIEQLDSAIHERPEQVLAAEIVRLQSEIDALKEQVRKLESAIDR